MIYMKRLRKNKRRSWITRNNTYNTQIIYKSTKYLLLTNELLYFHKNDGQQLLVIPQAVVPELLELYHAHEFT